MKDLNAFRTGLNQLSPETPWTHLFEFEGAGTISAQESETFYKKAIGLRQIGDLTLRLCKTYCQGNSLEGKKVLDIACGEGGHALAYAQAGAEVLGVEGRELYVRRANFMADFFGASNMKVIEGDVRKLSPETTGMFDITLCSGILHHLGQDDFYGFLKSTADVTKDMMILYTHVGSPEAQVQHALKGPVKARNKFEGYLFREHRDGASEEEKLAQVRASLDNTWSFWATNPALVLALRHVGFESVVKVYEPHVFNSFENRNFRQIMIAKKKLAA